MYCIAFVFSSVFVHEQAIIFNFNQLLEDIGQGKVSLDIDIEG